MRSKFTFLFFALLCISTALAQKEQSAMKAALSTITKQKDAKKILLDSYGAKEKDWDAEIKTIVNSLFDDGVIFNYSPWLSDDQNAEYKRKNTSSHYIDAAGNWIPIKEPERIKLETSDNVIDKYQVEVGRWRKEWVSSYDSNLRYKPVGEHKEWWQVVTESEALPDIDNSSFKSLKSFNVRRRNSTSTRTRFADQVTRHRAALLRYTLDITDGVMQIKCNATLYFDYVYDSEGWRAVSNIVWPAVCHPVSGFDYEPYYNLVLAKMHRFADPKYELAERVMKLDEEAQAFFLANQRKSMPGMIFDGQYMTWTDILKRWQDKVASTPKRPREYPEVERIVNGISFKEIDKSVEIETKPDYEGQGSDYDKYSEYSVLHTEFTLNPNCYFAGKTEAGRMDGSKTYHPAAEFLTRQPDKNGINNNPYLNNAEYKRFRIFKDIITDDGNTGSAWIAIDPETGVCYSPDGFIPVSQFEARKEDVKNAFANPFYFEKSASVFEMAYGQSSPEILVGQFFYDKSLNLYEYWGRHVDPLNGYPTDFFITPEGNVKDLKLSHLTNKATVDFYLNNFAGKEVALLVNKGSSSRPQIEILAQGTADKSLTSDNDYLCFTVNGYKQYFKDVKFNAESINEYLHQILILKQDLQSLLDAANEKNDRAIALDKQRAAQLEQKKLASIRQLELMYKNIKDIKKVFSVRKTAEWSDGDTGWIVDTPQGHVWILTSESGTVIHTRF